jgi:hypothetical protein
MALLLTLCLFLQQDTTLLGDVPQAGSKTVPRSLQLGRQLMFIRQDGPIFGGQHLALLTEWNATGS